MHLRVRSSCLLSLATCFNPASIPHLRVCIPCGRRLRALYSGSVGQCSASRPCLSRHLRRHCPLWRGIVFLLCLCDAFQEQASFTVAVAPAFFTSAFVSSHILELFSGTTSLLRSTTHAEIAAIVRIRGQYLCPLLQYASAVRPIFVSISWGPLWAISAYF